MGVIKQNFCVKFFNLFVLIMLSLLLRLNNSAKNSFDATSLCTRNRKIVEIADLLEKFTNDDFQPLARNLFAFAT